MRNDVDSLQRGQQKVAVGDIAANELRRRRYVARQSVGMNLRLKAVEDTYLETLPNKAVGEVSADEPRTTGYENAHDFMKLLEQEKQLQFDLPNLFAGTREHSRQSAKQNLGVQPKRPAPDILEIQAYPLIQIVNPVAALDLPQTGHSRFYRQLLLLIAGKALVLVQ